MIDGALKSTLPASRPASITQEDNMRKINHFKAKGGRIFSLRDSTTGRGNVMATWRGKPKRFWVKVQWDVGHYIEDGRPFDIPIVDWSEVYLLDEGEVPEPQEGWSYAAGFFG